MGPPKVLKYQIIVLEAFGLWSNKRNVLNHLYSLFAFYFISISFIVSLMTSLLFVKSTKQVVDHLIVLNSTVLAFLKGLVFYYKYTKHMEVFELIEKLDKDIDRQSHSEVTVMQTVEKYSNLLSYGFATCYAIAWISLAIQSIFYGSEQMFWTSTTFYPGDINQNRTLFWIVLIFQAFAGLVAVTATFACDSYGPIVIMILNGHIDVLALRLRNLGSEQIEEEAVETASKSRIDAKFELIKCIKTFYTCLRFANLFDDSMSFAYLFQFGVSGIALCICAFQIAVVTWSELATFAFIIIFFLCMFIEIYIPCFFGTLLRYKSDKLTEAAFHSNWTEQSPYFKRNLLIFAQGTIKPIRICGGGLFELNLPIFLSITRMAYSMFALLRNVQRL